MNMIHEKKGYATERVTFTSAQDVDLAANPITFEINSGPQVLDVYNLPGKSRWKQNGQTVTIVTTKWWPVDAPYILQAGQIVSFSLAFTAPIDGLQIDNFRLGTQSESSPSSTTDSETTSTSTTTTTTTSTSPTPISNRVIGGYWENWKPAIKPGTGTVSDKSYYSNDIANLSHVYYSFLTLAQKTSPSDPPKQYWDGKALYESMTASDVLTVMTKTDPLWDNEGEWQRKKIAALIKQTRAQGSKFIWAIGGWSDVTKTIKSTQVSGFANKCAQLLKLEGDGIDFDWEHLSSDNALVAEQRKTMADTLMATRQSLDMAGLGDKEISYTTRFNSFWDNDRKPAGYAPFNSDGEGIAIDAHLKEQGSSLRQVVNKVNIMMYDVPPADLNSPAGFTLETYKKVLNAFEQYLDKSQIVMGFEPGYQAAAGVWEGMKVDEEVIDYIYDNGYGGVMFWAINQPAIAPSLEVTGENCQALAKYAKNKFA